jgi:hypothetical protein
MLAIKAESNNAGDMGFKYQISNGKWQISNGKQQAAGNRQQVTGSRLLTGNMNGRPPFMGVC